MKSLTRAEIYGRTLSQLAGVIVLVGFAQTALAGNVLFSGVLKRSAVATPLTMASASNVVVQTNPGTPVNGFTVPDQAFAGSFSFSGAFTGYPFFEGYVEVNGGPASFNAGALTNTYTVAGNDTAYPNAPATPPPGWMRMKPGPNGFGGNMPIHRNDTYDALVSVTVGLSAVDIYLDYDYGVPGVDISGSYGGWSKGEHTFLTSMGVPQQRAAVYKVQGVIGMTGTATVSAPLAQAEYEISTAMDNRNAAGTTGMIQVMTPRLMNLYYVVPNAQGNPPLDGTGTVTALGSDWSTKAIYELTFLPEPGQWTLLGIGIAGLVGIIRLRRD